MNRPKALAYLALILFWGLTFALFVTLFFTGK